MKKFISTITAVLLSLCLCIGFAACGENNAGGGSDDDTVYYTVTFDSQGGSAVESQEILAGNPARAPVSPAKDNFNFNGWYKSADEDAALWNFATDRVNEDITLYAHWEAIVVPPEPTATLQYERSGDGYIVTGDAGQAESIVIPAEYSGSPVIGIAERAFAYSRHPSSITSVIIPDSVTEIGQNAFNNQHYLEEVHIGEDSALEKIGSNAFSGCSALKSFYLPAGCVSLGYDANTPHYTVTDSDYIESFGAVFNNCGALDGFTVASGNTAFASLGGHLVYIGGEHGAGSAKILVRGVNASEIPSDVTEIGEAAFRDAIISSITIPATVTKIGKYAFEDCADLSEIIFLGTRAQWEAVEKGFYWNDGTADPTVNCSGDA